MHETIKKFFEDVPKKVLSPQLAAAYD